MHRVPSLSADGLLTWLPWTAAGVALALLVVAGCGPSKPVDTRSGASPRPSMRAAPRARPDVAPDMARRAVPAKGLRVTGRLEVTPGQTLPPKAKVVLLWSVSSGSPDYLYVFGAGTSTGASFEVTLRRPPPAEALNSGLLGVGILVLLRPGTHLPAGRLDRKAWRSLKKATIGGADRYGVLYRHPAVPRTTGRHWSGKLSPGYSCGRGFQPANSRFEGFGPLPCTNLRIKVAPWRKLHWVNWT